MEARPTRAIRGELSEESCRKRPVVRGLENVKYLSNIQPVKRPQKKRPKNKIIISIHFTQSVTVKDSTYDFFHLRKIQVISKNSIEMPVSLSLSNIECFRFKNWRLFLKKCFSNFTMAEYRKISFLLSFLWFSFKNANLGLKMITLKFLGIQSKQNSCCKSAFRRNKSSLWCCC